MSVLGVADTMHTNSSSSGVFWITSAGRFFDVFPSENRYSTVIISPIVNDSTHHPLRFFPNRVERCFDMLYENILKKIYHLLLL